MTAIEAIQMIILDARSKTASVTSLHRIRKVGKSLGLTDQEQIALEQRLEYRDSSGKLYDYFVKRGAK